MFIIWIIFFSGMITVFVGLYENRAIYLILGGLLLFLTTLTSFFIVLNRYRSFTRSWKEKSSSFLLKNLGESALKGKGR